MRNLEHLPVRIPQNLHLITRSRESSKLAFLIIYVVSG